MRRRIAYQVAGADLAFALDVGGPGFHPGDVRLLQPQFGGILDRHDAFLRQDRRGQGVEQSGLAAAGAAGNQHIETGANAGGQKINHFLGDGVSGHHVAHLQGLAAEMPDRHERAIQGERRNDGVDTAAVGQPGVHHGTGLIDPSADASDHPLHRLDQMFFVIESGRDGLPGNRAFRHRSPWDR